MTVMLRSFRIACVLALASGSLWPISGAAQDAPAVDEPATAAPQDAPSDFDILVQMNAALRQQVDRQRAECASAVVEAPVCPEPQTDRIASLEAAVSEAQSETARLEATVAEAQNEAARLAAELASLRGASNTAGDGLRTELDLARNALSVARDDLRTERARLSDTAARIARYESRLADLGYSLEPSFSYSGGPSESYISLRALLEAPRDASHLAAADCPRAIAWLQAQSEPALPTTLEVWVWDRDNPLICKPNSGGGEVLMDPGPSGSASAHLVVLR